MLPPLVPETSASTNSATSAGVVVLATGRPYGIDASPTTSTDLSHQSSLNAGRLDGLIHNCEYAEIVSC